MRDIPLATIPATIPTLAVLVGILLNQNGINRLDARMNSFDSPMNSFEFPSAIRNKMQPHLYLKELASGLVIVLRWLFIA